MYQDRMSALAGASTDYVSKKGQDLLARWAEHQAYCDLRTAEQLAPYWKVSMTPTGTEVKTRMRDGRLIEGVNFASQDYLNLSSHPAVHEAAKAAIDAYGVHSAGSVALMGCTEMSERLETELAAFLGYADCTVFPIGWAAGYGVIKTLVRPTDHVVIDQLAHACLQEGALGATRNVHYAAHCSNAAMERKLKRIRDKEPDAGILVVTETVFSMDSDVPDIPGLQRLCQSYGATLMVDVAHDLGAIGPTGRGYLEIMNMIGKVDIVMGSFSKTFASNGGFVACNHPALKLALRGHCGPSTFTNAISPVQAAIVLAALGIVQSGEGASLRRQLMGNVHYLQAAFQTAGFKVTGRPSAIVPIFLGDMATSRKMTREIYRQGVVVNLVEHPAVARNACRWRAQLMARHTTEQMDRFLEAALEARDSLQDAPAALENTASLRLVSPAPGA